MAIDPDAIEAIKNAYFVSIHHISEAKYKEMIQRFWGSVPPPPKQFLASTMIADQEDPKTRILALAPDFDKRINNNEITGVFVDNPLGVLGTTPIYYSVPFLRGLNFIYDMRGDVATGKYLYFSKAIDDGNTNTVVVMLKDIVTDRILYHGDLTNMIP